MNSKQMQDAVALGRVCNFSQAAQEFDMSQPVFSKQIIALENELGVKLFDRSTTPLSLTAAGEYFVQKAKKLLFEQENMLKTMEKYKSGDVGKLTIGVAPFRSLYVMPDIVAAVKERFPQVHITLCELGLSYLQKGLREGLYDFAIMNLPVDETEFDVIPLEADSVVLAVPQQLVHLIDCNESAEKVSMEDCKKLPFVTVGRNQEMRKLFDNLCAKANVEPEIFVEVTGITTAREMVKKGLAAAVLPKQFLKSESENSDIKMFEIEHSEYVRQPAVVVVKNQYVSDYAKFAIELLKER